VLLHHYIRDRRTESKVEQTSLNVFPNLIPRSPCATKFCPIVQIVVDGFDLTVKFKQGLDTETRIKAYPGLNTIVAHYASSIRFLQKQ
jgi:hypothetical protein